MARCTTPTTTLRYARDSRVSALLAAPRARSHHDDVGRAATHQTTHWKPPPHAILHRAEPSPAAGPGAAAAAAAKPSAAPARPGSGVVVPQKPPPPAPGSLERRSALKPRNVTVNGVALSDHEIATFEFYTETSIPDGKYWYDAQAGIWGEWHQPAKGWIQPNIPMTGTLAPDASAGNTRVFVNGRQLHMVDLQVLQANGVLLSPGQWWVDPTGAYGTVVRTRRNAQLTALSHSLTHLATGAGELQQDAHWTVVFIDS